MNYQLFNQYAKYGIASSSTPSTISVHTPTVKEPKYRFEACSKDDLNIYLGYRVDYKGWNEHVHLEYGVVGMKYFLVDSSLCQKHTDISSSIKLNLCKALKDGHFLFLVKKHKHEMIASVFYTIFEHEAVETLDQRVRESQEWWHLFTYSLDITKGYTLFVNDYNKSITTLKEVGSK